MHTILILLLQFICIHLQDFSYSYVYIGKSHIILFLLYMLMFLRAFIIIIINNRTVIIFIGITFSIFWIFFLWEIPRSEITESKGTDIILRLLKDIAKMLSERSLPIYNEFKDPFLSNFRSTLTIHVVILTFCSQCFLHFPWNSGAYDFLFSRRDTAYSSILNYFPK